MVNQAVLARGASTSKKLPPGLSVWIPSADPEAFYR
jgi:hypothetical protein